MTKLSRYEETGLTPHMEDYIEKIWLLSQSNRVVRVKDIAESLNIKMPSVTAAVKRLKESGLIEYEKYGFIELTDIGKQTAKNIFKKHECLKEFFEKILQLNETTSGTEACRMEHHLEKETFERIVRFIDFFNAEKKKNAEWTERLSEALNSESKQ